MTDFLSFVIFSILVPIGVVGGIFGGIKLALRRARLLDVFRDKGVYPSLSRFQALLWTLVFAYTILSVFCIGHLTSIKTSSVDAASNYTTTLLLGALTSVAFSQGLSENKYQQYYNVSIDTTQPQFADAIPRDRPRKFITMLMEDDKYSITRVQLFAWTWIALFVYVLTFSLNLSAAFAYQEKVTVILPDIDHNLLVLSGISQAGFVAGKAAVKAPNAARANAAANTALFTPHN